MDKCKRCGDYHPELDAYRNGWVGDDTFLLNASQQSSYCETAAKKRKKK